MRGPRRMGFAHVLEGDVFMENATVAGLPAWLSVFLGIYLVLWSLLAVGLVIALLFIVAKVRRLSARASREIRDASQRLRAATAPVSSAVSDLSERAKRIGDIVESTVKEAAHRVDVASDALTNPVVNVMAFIAGVKKGLVAAKKRLPRDDRPSGD